MNAGPSAEARWFPEFVRGSPLLEGAFGVALAAHHGACREGDTKIDHPLAVAELLHAQGFEEEVVAAALLHDVVEDTSTPLAELAEWFEPRGMRPGPRDDGGPEHRGLLRAKGGAPLEDDEERSRRVHLRG